MITLSEEQEALEDLADREFTDAAVQLGRRAALRARQTPRRAGFSRDQLPRGGRRRPPPLYVTSATFDPRDRFPRRIRERIERHGGGWLPIGMTPRCTKQASSGRANSSATPAEIRRRSAPLLPRRRHRGDAPGIRRRWRRVVRHAVHRDRPARSAPPVRQDRRLIVAAAAVKRVDRRTNDSTSRTPGARCRSGGRRRATVPTRARRRRSRGRRPTRGRTRAASFRVPSNAPRPS